MRGARISWGTIKRVYWSVYGCRKRLLALALKCAADGALQASLLVSLPAVARWRRGPRHPGATDGVRPRHVLVISYYSYPYWSAYGTQNVGKFIKYLTRLGWTITLVSTTPASASEQDPEDEPLPASVNVVRLPASELTLFEAVPDRFIRWIYPAARAAIRLGAEQPIGAVFATAPPYSSLIAGAIASTRLRVPLVCGFRDPWSRVDSPEVWVINHPVLRRLTEWLERLVLRASYAAIMVVEPRYKELFFVDPSLTQVTSILNGFDEDDFRGLRPDRDQDRFTISYVGTIYDDETFQNFVMPLRRWQQQYPADFDEVLFEYAGASSSFFDRHGFRPSFLRDHGYVSHREAIQIRLRSDLQLFSQPTSFKPHIMSGKIYEMIRSGAPILAITDPAGAVADLIERTKTGTTLRRGDPDGVACKLREYYLRWKETRAPLRTAPSLDALGGLSREQQARQLSRLLERALADG